jgi:hypothetical protein
VRVALRRCVRMMYDQEQTLLRSAKGLGLSVEPIRPSFFPFPPKFAATTNSRSYTSRLQN